MSEGDIWEGYEPCSVSCEGFPTLRIMLRDLRESGGQKLAVRDRPYRDGTKLDALGAAGKSFIFTALFTNDAEEPGVTDDGGPPMYPDRLDLLTEMFDSGRTMTLNTPFRRAIRVKCHPWDRAAVAEGERGAEVLSGTFLEDNEDSVDRETIVRPSARGAMQRRVEQAQFDAESEGIWSPSLADLTQFVSELLGIISTPGEYWANVEFAAARVQRCIDDIRITFTREFDGRRKLDDPEGARMRRRLLELEELAARAEAEARNSRPATQLYFPDRTTTIWKIATKLKQNAQLLIDMNGSLIEDFSYITQGTPVRVFQL